MDKYILAKQLKSSINKHMESPTKDSRKNVVYWTIRYVPYIDDDDIEDREVLIQLVDMQLKKMTYRDLVNIFPIKKFYDGGKWETKDYFYTMNYIEDHGGLDAYIEDPFNMIWDYQNKYIRMFGVKWMDYVNDKMQEASGIDIFNAFFNTDEYPRDSKGNLIGVDKNGRVHKVANPHSTKATLRVLK